MDNVPGIQMSHWMSPLEAIELFLDILKVLRSPFNTSVVERRPILVRGLKIPGNAVPTLEIDSTNIEIILLAL